MTGFLALGLVLAGRGKLNLCRHRVAAVAVVAVMAAALSVVALAVVVALSVVEHAVVALAVVVSAGLPARRRKTFLRLNV